MKIIIDSTTDLPEDIIEKYDMDILPLRVQIEDKEYLDKIDIKVEEVYDAMRKGIYPKTSLPNPIDAYELFKKYASQGIDFVYYALSSGVSSTYQVIHQMVEELKKEYPHVNMEVIDSKGGTICSGLVAIQAGKMCQLGGKFEDIVESTKELINHSEYVFTLDNLNWLLKGGRVKKSQAIIGSALKINPVLHVHDGAINVIGKIRGRKKALKKTVSIALDRMKDFPNQTIGIAHADDLEAALEVKDMINEKTGKNNNFIIEQIGSVLGVHLGIGGVGILFFNKQTENYVE